MKSNKNRKTKEKPANHTNIFEKFDDNEHHQFIYTRNFQTEYLQNFVMIFESRKMLTWKKQRQYYLMSNICRCKYIDLNFFEFDEDIINFNLQFLCFFPENLCLGLLFRKNTLEMNS